MADEKSCGAIVFTHENGIRKYVIIRETGIYQGYCGFPKGHMEAGETEQDTAIREVKEETGLDVELLDGFRQVDELMERAETGMPLSIVYYPQINEYMGRRTVQIVITGFM